MTDWGGFKKELKYHNVKKCHILRVQLNMSNTNLIAIDEKVRILILHQFNHEILNHQKIINFILRHPDM